MSYSPSPVIPAKITLREIRADDLPILFEHQVDPVATRMAAFPARGREAFMAHWAKIMANPACALRCILADGHVAGHIGAWTDDSDRLVGYWVGREFWGRGVATAALARFLECEPTRPLTAHVVEHNAASIRVLQKTGFILVGENTFKPFTGETARELIFKYAGRS